MSNICLVVYMLCYMRYPSFFLTERKLGYLLDFEQAFLVPSGTIISKSELHTLEIRCTHTVLYRYEHLTCDTGVVVIRVRVNRFVQLNTLSLQLLQFRLQITLCP